MTAYAINVNGPDRRVKVRVTPPDSLPAGVSITTSWTEVPMGPYTIPTPLHIWVSRDGNATFQSTRFTVSTSSELAGDANTVTFQLNAFSIHQNCANVAALGSVGTLEASVTGMSPDSARWMSSDTIVMKIEPRGRNPRLTAAFDGSATISANLAGAVDSTTCHVRQIPTSLDVKVPEVVYTAQPFRIIAVPRDYNGFGVRWPVTYVSEGILASVDSTGYVMPYSSGQGHIEIRAPGTNLDYSYFFQIR